MWLFTPDTLNAIEVARRDAETALKFPYWPVTAILRAREARSHRYQRRTFMAPRRCEQTNKASPIPYRRSLSFSQWLLACCEPTSGGLLQLRRHRALHGCLSVRKSLRSISASRFSRPLPCFIRAGGRFFFAIRPASKPAFAGRSNAMPGKPVTGLALLRLLLRWTLPWSRSSQEFSFVRQRQPRANEQNENS
jgi:hypothetical protein